MSNGYNFCFIKSFWELVKEDITKVLVQFHSNGLLPKGTNATFLALIPKTDSPQCLG